MFGFSYHLEGIASTVAMMNTMSRSGKPETNNKRRSTANRPKRFSRTHSNPFLFHQGSNQSNHHGIPRATCQDDGPASLPDVHLGQVDAMAARTKAAEGSAVAATSEAGWWWSPSSTNYTEVGAKAYSV